jgi:hypothetical protein
MDSLLQAADMRSVGKNDSFASPVLCAQGLGIKIVIVLAFWLAAATG